MSTSRQTEDMDTGIDRSEMMQTTEEDTGIASECLGFRWVWQVGEVIWVTWIPYVEEWWGIGVRVMVNSDRWSTGKEFRRVSKTSLEYRWGKQEIIGEQVRGSRDCRRRGRYCKFSNAMTQVSSLYSKGDQTMTEEWKWLMKGSWLA